MKNSTRSHYFRGFFVFCFVLFGFLLAGKELYLSGETSLLPSQPQVMAATTTSFTPIENNLPVPKVSTKQTATVAAKPAEKEAFEAKVPVLMYHHVRDVLLVTDRSDIEFSVSPRSLEDQLSFLHDEGYQTLTLNDIFDSLENGTPLPPKSVVLTFDDGFRDFYTSAFPLLKKYNMRSVMFYVAGYSNFPGYMDQNMLKEIHKSGLVDVEAHTMNHLVLTNLKPEDLQTEVAQSKQILQTLLNKKINYFAYPYGMFDQNVINTVSNNGYRLAFGTTPGTVLKQSEKLTLPRIAITGFDDIKRFEQKLGVTSQEKEKINITPTEDKTTTESAQERAE